MSSVQSSQAYEDSTKGLVAAGVAGFAGIMLAVVGVLEILQGISAIANDNVFVKGVKYTYEFDVTAWGWIHLVIGLIAVAVGVAIVTGHTVGYLAGVAVAFLAAVANFAFMPYYPFWALVLIAFNVFVIWALCVQLGRDRVDEAYYAGQDVPAGSSMPAATEGSVPPPRRPSSDTPTSMPT